MIITKGGTGGGGDIQTWLQQHWRKNCSKSNYWLNKGILVFSSCFQKCYSLIISVVMYLAIIILGHQSANCFEATHVIQVSVLYATVQVRDFLKYIVPTYLLILLKK